MQDRCGGFDSHQVHLRCIMTTNVSTAETSLAAPVAPEDVRCGDFVAILSEVIELPSFMWCDYMPGPADQPVRVRYCTTDGGTPLKVKAICLPFVFVKSPQGQSRTIDVRHTQFARLERGYAKTVWKDLRSQRPKV